MRDTLFLLQPGFVDPRLSQDRYYCTECAALEGLLVFTSTMRDQLEVRRIAFERPRSPLVDLLGPDHQNCPMLILGESAAGARGVETSSATGRQFLTGLIPIGEYLASKYGVPPAPPMSETTASLSKDGTILAEQVSVELTVEGSAASRWYGSFRMGPKVPLSLDATCLLTFADGRRGEAEVTRIAYAGPRDPVRVHFRGKSDLV